MEKTELLMRMEKAELLMNTEKAELLINMEKAELLKKNFPFHMNYISFLVTWKIYIHLTLEQ